MTMSRVVGEGPEEQIRNALQIVNGLSYLLERTSQSPGVSYFEARELMRESTAGLENRLSVALAQLTTERYSAAGTPSAQTLG